MDEGVAIDSLRAAAPDEALEARAALADDFRAEADSLRAVELVKQHPGKMWTLEGDLVYTNGFEFSDDCREAINAPMLPRTLRDAFGAFPSGVVAVASSVKGQLTGIAASSEPFALTVAAPQGDPR